MTLSLEVSISGFDEEFGVDGKPFVIYLIHIKYQGTKKWIVRRRFSEFVTFHERLRLLGHKEINSFSFPSRISFRLSKLEVAQHRSPILEEYLNFVLTLQPFPADVVDFLRLDMMEAFNNQKETISVARDSKFQGSDISSPMNHQMKERTSSFGDVEGLEKLRLQPLSGGYTPQGVTSPAGFNPVFRLSSAISSTASAVTNFPKQLSFLTSKKTQVSYKFRSRDDIEKELEAIAILFSFLSVEVFSVIALVLLILRGIWTFRASPYEVIAGIYLWVCSFTLWSVYTIKVALFCFLFTITIHRFVGYIMNHFLGYLLMENGGFHMTIDWASLRLGFDRNELILHNFTWHNAPAFKQTPYFVCVKQAILVFDIISVYNAIFVSNSTPIRIHFIELDTGDVYMEKMTTEKSSSLNLWAALGAENDSQEAEVKSSVLASMAKAVDYTTSAGKEIADVVLKYNPATMLFKGAKFAAKHVKSSIQKVPFGFKKSKADEEDDGLGNNEERTSFSNTELNGPNGASEGGEKQLAMSKQPNEDGVFDGEDEREEDNDPTAEDDADEENNSPTNRDSMSPRKTEIKSKESTVEEVKGWGVPYLFEVDRVTVRDLKLHAQDFVNAEHADTEKATFIHLSLMNMVRKELTKPPKKKGEHRRPVYLDDFVWKVVNRAIANLLSTNRFALLSIVSSAAANHTTTAVRDVANFATKGVKDTIRTLNPLNLLASKSNSESSRNINASSSSAVSEGSTTPSKEK